MSLGAELAAARERAGLTTTQVADRTMIRRTLVEDIERDDYHSCGGRFYARGHIKSIAHAIGTDPAPLLAEFDRENVDPDLPTASGVLDTAHVDGAGAAARLPRPNWSAAMAVAIAAVLVVGVVHFVTSGGGGTPTETAATAPRVSSTAPASSSPQSSTQPQGESSPSAPADAGVPSDAIANASEGVTVVLKADTGRSWVSATGKDAGVLYQNVIGTGQEQTFRDDKQVKLVVGNAAAVHLVVNGHDLGAAGGQGEVVRLTFGPGDPGLASG